MHWQILSLEKLLYPINESRNMNFSQLNNDLFNQDHTFAESAVYNIAFNGYDLMSLVWSTAWVLIQTGNPYDISAVEIASFVSSLADGWSIVDKKYWNKTISFTMAVQWTDNNDLIYRLDDLKKNTQGIEWFFDITIAWEVRRYDATVSWLRIPPFKRTDDFVQWIEIEMLITSPFWRKTAFSSVYVQNQTANFSKVVSNDWTYESYPIVEIITNTWSTLSAISFEMKKIWEPVWYTISITTAIPPASVVIFDFMEKKVTVNDTEVNFSWIMMPMDIWQSVFTFTLTGSINVNAYILHYPTFI